MMDGFHSPFHLQKRDPVPVPLFLFTKKLETKPHQFSWFSGTLHVMFCDLQLSGGNALKLIYLTPRLRSAHIRSLASSDCSQLRSLFSHVGHATNHVEGCLRRTNLAYLGIVLGHKKKKLKPQATNSLLAAVVKEGIQSVPRVYEAKQL